MLSFSTKGSAKSDETEKVANAVAIAKEKAPELTLDGEFQFDAAFVPSVAEKKAPDSVIKGSTADTVRPALQIIKTKEGVKKTSGVFIMARGDEQYVFADCAINIAPDSQDLAEIAIESANTAKMFELTLDGVDIYDPHTYEGMEDLVQAFVERRKGKATEEQARQILLDENYFGTMLVYKGLADGLVSGAAQQGGYIVADLFTTVQGKVAGKGVKIVFPEGLDERILTAVNKLAGNNVLKPILVGNEQEIKDKANGLKLNKR
ncbi:hypothetical protein DT075_00570 [Bacillus licheniformis]|nr:hypothetical protein DT075_00570 [Bacillus licheniformis]